MAHAERMAHSNAHQGEPQGGGVAVPLTAFAVGAVVAVLLGVFGKLHEPTLTGASSLGFDTLLDMKVALSMVIGVLALLPLGPQERLRERGGAKGTRTPNPLLAKQVRYQLRHGPLGCC